MSDYFEHQARRSFWRVHGEAWRQSGSARAAYRRERRFNARPLTRWLNPFFDRDVLLKPPQDLRKRRRKTPAEPAGGTPRRHRYGARIDTRSPILRAFHAMHGKAMNWSGMGLSASATALRLSQSSLRKWRDPLEDGAVIADSWARLHPRACARIRPSPKRKTDATGLAAAP